MSLSRSTAAAMLYDSAAAILPVSRVAGKHHLPPGAT
jgi:hypothetical protein